MEVVRYADRWGRMVVLTAECWIDHILRRRPYFLGSERSCVEEALFHPTLVTHDVDYSDRECFYYPSPLPYPYGGVFVKVVVAYNRAAAEAEQGTVVTVYLTPKPKPGEQQRWP